MDNNINTIDDIIKLYEELGNSDYIGEEVTQTEHAIQSALQAREEGYDDETVVACLLHDIGHLIGLKYNYEEMENLGCLFHENIGSEVLKRVGMSDKVCILVKNHVNTKRYLVTKYDSYYNNLSEASKKTLNYQGGKMSQEELKAFEEDNLFNLHLKLGNWDDRAKVKNLKLPHLSEFKESLLKSQLQRL